MGMRSFRWETTSACGIKKSAIAISQRTTCEGPALTAVPKKSGTTTRRIDARTRSVKPSSLRSDADCESTYGPVLTIGALDTVVKSPDPIPHLQSSVALVCHVREGEARGFGVGADYSGRKKK